MSSVSISFRKAPLVEIVVDLRWRPVVQPVPTQPVGPQPTASAFLPTPQIENLIHRFGGEVYKRGFQRAERLVPSGLFVLPGQPLSRFKKADVDNVLYQIGVGMFSANAVPPYRSWEQFTP